MKVALSTSCGVVGVDRAPVMAACESEAEYMSHLNKRLLVGWEAKLNEEGRIYYVK